MHMNSNGSFLLSSFWKKKKQNPLGLQGRIAIGNLWLAIRGGGERVHQLQEKRCLITLTLTRLIYIYARQKNLNPTYLYLYIFHLDLQLVSYSTCLGNYGPDVDVVGI